MPEIGGVALSNAYEKGRRFEYRVRDYLTGLGYLVIRSPQSRSPFDLIAIMPQDLPILLVQCKVDGVLPPSEWNALFELTQRYPVMALCVFRAKRKLEWRRLMAAKVGRRTQPWLRVCIGEKDGKSLDPARALREP